MNKIGVAVIGAGVAGEANAAGYAAAAEWVRDRGATVNLVAIADPASGLASQVAARHGYGMAVESWEDLAVNVDVDLVSVAAPDSFHREIVVGLAAAGKHILCEKPLATSLTEAREMHEAVQAGTGRAWVSHEFRCVPAVEGAEWYIKNGELGDITHVQGRFLANYGLDEANRTTWRFFGAPGSGVIGDIGSHLIDMSELLLGPLESIGGCQLRGVSAEEGRNEDLAAFTASFANGAVGSFTLSRVSPGHFIGLGLDIYGTRGNAYLDLTRPATARLVVDGNGNGALSERDLVTPARQDVSLESRIAETYNDWFNAQTLTVVGELLGLGTAARCPTLAQELRTMELLNAIAESAAQNGANVDVTSTVGQPA